MAASAARAIAAEGGAVFVTSRTPAHLEALGGGDRGGRRALGLARRRPAARGRRRGGVRRVRRGLRAAGRRLQRRRHQRAAVRGRAAPRGDARGLGDRHRRQRHEPVPRRPRGGAADARPGARTPAARGDDPADVVACWRRGPRPSSSRRTATRRPRARSTPSPASTAATYAPHGIRVNAIAPSLIATPMSRRAQDDEAIARLPRAEAAARRRPDRRRRGHRRRAPPACPTSRGW